MNGRRDVLEKRKGRNAEFDNDMICYVCEMG